MTQLPTRETDGGVDWDKLVLQAWGAYWVAGDKVPSMIVFGTLELAKAVAAHERERCAKVAEANAKYFRRAYYNGDTWLSCIHAYDDGIYTAVDAIRKLEP